MLLAADIGNTNIVFGVHDGTGWRHTWRIQTVRDRMPDEYAVSFRSFFHDAGLAFADLDQIILSSVVPQLTLGFAAMLREQTGIDPLIVSGALKTGVTIDQRFIHEIGPDLIANAAAAYAHFKFACIVVDFGTATSFTLVDGRGEIIGVTISAGLRTTHNALVENAAMLPPIPLLFPESVVGRNTVQALQAGLVIGHLAMVEGLLARMKAELGEAKVAATGGLSSLFKEHSAAFDFLDPMLTLNGLSHIAALNR